MSGDLTALLTIRAMGLNGEGQMTSRQWEEHCTSTPGLAEAWEKDPRNPRRKTMGDDGLFIMAIDDDKPDPNVLGWRIRCVEGHVSIRECWEDEDEVYSDDVSVVVPMRVWLVAVKYVADRTTRRTP